MTPTEPAQADVARDALGRMQHEQGQQRSVMWRHMALLMLGLAGALALGVCGLAGASAAAQRTDRTLWVKAMSTRAELDCCAGTTGPCHEAGEALALLSRRLHQREESTWMALSRAAGSLIGTADVEIGVGYDMNAVDAALHECTERDELLRARTQLRQRLGQSR